MDTDDAIFAWLRTWGAMLAGLALIGWGVFGLVTKHMVAHGRGGLRVPVSGEDATIYAVIILVIGGALALYGFLEWLSARGSESR